MREILGDHAPRIGKSELRYGEGNPVFRLVFLSFSGSQSKRASAMRPWYQETNRVSI
jgi:hypothetical protein